LKKIGTKASYLIGQLCGVEVYKARKGDLKMDEADSIIKFHCKNCGQKIRVPQIHAGKKGKCPKCKNIIVVPKVQTAGTLTEQSNAEEAKTNTKSSPYVLTLLDVPEKDKIQDQPIRLSSVPEKAAKYEQELEEESPVDTESPAERKLPWVIDIFLYPISMPGLITLGIIILIPLLINIAVGLLGPFGLFVLVPGFFINIVISLYFLCYVVECIRDSAVGGIRAPETLANTPGLGDPLLKLFRLLACLLLFVGPAGYYYVYCNGTDTIYWSLLAFGLFFLPMGLLAVTLFDSIRGLNPILIIGSIFSTFFQYCGLLLILAAVVLTVKAVRNIPFGKWLAFISVYIGIYIVLVLAHLLGRFYWRYQEKLNWEV